MAPADEEALPSGVGAPLSLDLARSNLSATPSALPASRQALQLLLSLWLVLTPGAKPYGCDSRAAQRGGWAAGSAGSFHEIDGSRARGGRQGKAEGGKKGGRKGAGVTGILQAHGDAHHSLEL